MTSPVDQIKDRLDIVEVINNYVRLKKAGARHVALCPFHTEKTPSFTVTQEKQMWYCFGCFPPGQKVKTPFGLHNIESLDENHYVYSGQGRIRKILAAHSRNYKGDMVKVEVRKLVNPVLLTSDHNLKVIRPKTKYLKKTKQFYRQVRRRARDDGRNLDKIKEGVEKYGTLLETSAGNLREGDFVLYPINKSVTEVIELNLKNYLEKSYRRGPCPKDIPYEVSVTNDFLKLIGYYIAEGSDHRAYVRFSLGDHEEEFAKEIMGLIKKTFGLEAAIHKRKNNKTGIEITVCHSYLADIFANLCGRHADQKHIPFVFQELPPKKQLVLLNAIHRGDGHSYLASRSTKKYQSITTISPVLNEQITDILLRNNIFPSNTVTKAKIRKGVRHKTSYRVHWSKEAKPQHSLVYKTDEDIYYWLLPIKQITKKPYVGPVYNLTVEKDHSYIATNFAVSNCGQGGDLFTFVEKIEGIEFADALRLLAEKAGVKLERDDPKLRSQRKELYEIVEEAAKFFSRQLESKVGKAVIAYLRERGLSDDSIKDWRLGYAPDNWRALHDYLAGKGYTEAALEAAGLTVKSHDRFRHRIMFPIFDIQGQVIGFSGRVFDKIKSATAPEEAGKYINTPNTLVYDKSRVLYGLNRAKDSIREKDRVIIIEGNLDLILAHQAGTLNAAAVFGTALTESQLTLIRRQTTNLTLCFDSDDAGERATKRAAELALQKGFDVSVVTLPPGQDGAEVIREDAQGWQTIIANPVPFVEFILKRAQERFSPATLAGKKAIVGDVVGAITLLSSPVEREHWVRELAVQVGSTEVAIQEELRRVRTGASQESPISETPPPITTEEYLLILAAAYPKTKESFREIVEIVESAEIRQIINDFLAGGDIETVLRRDGRFAPLLARSAFLKDMIEDGEAEIARLCAELKRRAIKEKLRCLEADLKKAELAGASEQSRVLTQQFTALSRELSNYEKQKIQEI